MAIQYEQNSNTENPSFNVLVIGAGLAGLATAISIQQAGHQVTVLERMPEIREVSTSTKRSTKISSRLLKLQLRLALVFKFHPMGQGYLETGASLKQSSLTHSSLRKPSCAPTGVVPH